MNNPDPLNIITKYAALLLGFYLFEALIGYITGAHELDYPGGSFSLTLNTIIYYGLNIVMAIIIYKDRERFRIKGMYAEWIAIVYRPLGVVVFLLYMLYRKIASQTVEGTKTDGSLD